MTMGKNRRFRIEATPRAIPPPGLRYRKNVGVATLHRDGCRRWDRAFTCKEVGPGFRCPIKESSRLYELKKVCS